MKKKQIYTVKNLVEIWVRDNENVKKFHSFGIIQGISTNNEITTYYLTPLNDLHNQVVSTYINDEEDRWIFIRPIKFTDRMKDLLGFKYNGDKTYSMSSFQFQKDYPKKTFAMQTNFKTNETLYRFARKSFSKDLEIEIDSVTEVEKPIEYLSDFQNFITFTLGEHDIEPNFDILKETIKNIEKSTWEEQDKIK